MRIVTDAVMEAIRLGAIGFDAIKLVALARIERRPARLDLSAYPHLPKMDVRTGDLGSERLTGALRDRLTHHVHILTMNGDSYRLKQSSGRRRSPASDKKAKLNQAADDAANPEQGEVGILFTDLTSRKRPGSLVLR